MIRALAHHYALLLTFRHDGRGIPDSPAWTIAVWSICAALDAVRLGNPAGAALGAAFVVGVNLLCGTAKLATALGMLSIVASVAALVLVVGLSLPLAVNPTIGVALLALIVGTSFNFYRARAQRS